MKIVLDISHYDELSGFGIVTKNITKKIVELKGNDEIIFITNRPCNLSDIDGEFTLEIVNSGYMKYKIMDVPKFLKRMNADIYISIDHVLPFTKVCKYALIQHDIGMQHIGRWKLFRHYFQSDIYKSLYYLFDIEGSFIRSADLVITPSEYVKKDIVDFYEVSARKIVVINWGMDHLDCFPPSKVKKDYVLIPYDNMHDEFPFSLAKNIVSSGIAKKVILLKPSMVKMELPCDAIQIITGKISNEENARFYSEAKACIYLSMNDGFGFVPLESMHYGTPVLFNKNSSLEEISGGGGTCISDIEVYQFIKKLELLNKNSKSYQEQISNGKWFVQKYQWKESVTQLLKALRTLKHG